MKKLVVLLVAAVLAVIITGCASDRPIGAIYTQSAYDIQAGPTDLEGLKVGEATATCYFGIIGVGDCSIKAAAEQGKITKISYIDRKLENILGFSKMTTRVYGK